MPASERNKHLWISLSLYPFTRGEGGGNGDGPDLFRHPPEMSVFLSIYPLCGQFSMLLRKIFYSPLFSNPLFLLAILQCFSTRHLANFSLPLFPMFQADAR